MKELRRKWIDGRGGKERKTWKNVGLKLQIWQPVSISFTDVSFVPVYMSLCP